VAFRNPLWGVMGRTALVLSSSSDASVEDVVENCKQMICRALDTDTCVVRSNTDDPNGMHLDIEVVSALFEGKRSMQRQQLVFKSIWELLQDGGPVHAVDSIVCQTPDE